ncbi:SemiSWEET family transporter [Limosilactobacillus sp.]|uniref:SemiSWEET family transporter n=1 Tax=Limosilactobacillus sp. TaxID=2773925 RepID=UPI00345E4E36
MFKEANWIRALSVVASIIAVCMYVSYIPQIFNNLHGNYCAPLQPFVAGVNCTLWSIYAWFKHDRDWAVFIANFPGIFFAFITFFTSIH